MELLLSQLSGLDSHIHYPGDLRIPLGIGVLPDIALRTSKIPADLVSWKFAKVRS
jgi:hypothetical protein